MTFATVDADQRVLLARVIDRRLLARDEELVTLAEVTAAFAVRSDHLDVETVQLRQLDRAELPLPHLLDEDFGRLGKHDLRAALVAFVAVFVDEDAVLESLERERVAHVAARGIGHDRQARRRDVERDIGAANDEQLADG